MPRESFHPAVAAWFERRFGAPTPAQQRAWPAIRAGRSALVAAPTGSGKTLAAFLAAIDGLVRDGLATGALADETRVVYVSPLKSLSNDIRRNLEEPLSGIREELTRRGDAPVSIRTLVRSGDTPAAERAAMIRRPPQILVTTPESLYLLLTSAGGRALLATARSVIVDEIHAVIADRRGAHLALSLERLEDVVGSRGGGLARIGLSATQRPVVEVARYLVGAARVGADGTPDCEIVDLGHRRELDLGIELPASPLEAVMSNEVWSEVYDRLAACIAAQRTTLVFVNTRRLAERAARQLSQRLGATAVAAHHGSLSREQRLDAEQRLKAGDLRALVATSSLELGIDVGAVDLVCCVGSLRSVGTLLQRVGRSGHTLAGTPRGLLFPTSRGELVECAALLDAVRRGELEELEIPRGALDVLAQQLVAECSAGERGVAELHALVRRAWPYRDLARETFDEVVRVLAAGFDTRRGRRAALLHHDAVHDRLRARRGARLVALTSGGAIPDRADYHVVLEPAGTLVGTVDEDFAVESLPGHVFQLGNASWRIRRIEHGRMLVEDARGEAPTIPFWFGEAPARSRELSAAVSRLGEETGRRLERSREEALAWLAVEVGTGVAAARQVADYLAATRSALGTLPALRTVVLERFFDEAGDQHLVLHAPFGGRINRAWGLALRKRFCRRFNFELQAAATEDAIVLSLGPTHSFPAAEVFSFLGARTVRPLLVQALLDAPMFGIRWRWNAGRALAVPRMRGGRRVPPRLVRMQAEDLLASVFPDQLACLENVAGDREIPEHPLVEQTIRDCLHEAMDVRGLESLLAAIEREEVACRALDLTEPSPLAQEALAARPWAFLDDAPLEERRTHAVRARRWLDPAAAAELGRLDPQAIERVRAEAWPLVRDADELHDALVTLGCATAEEGRPWSTWVDELVAARRMTRLDLRRGPELWAAAERLDELLALHPEAVLVPPIAPVGRRGGRPDADAALVALVRSRLGATGPVTAAEIASVLGVDEPAVTGALAALEAEGTVLRGRFRPAAPADEWCERGLLARIHRRTIERLRGEIAPVTQQEFLRFLLVWQRVDPEHRARGPAGLVAVVEQLEGFEAAAAAWEGEILPARVEDYDPAWLDGLCLGGRVVWGRVGGAERGPAAARPVRTTPIVLLPRAGADAWRAGRPAGLAADVLSSSARGVHEALGRRGASFFEELVSDTGLLRTQVEAALAELVAAGMATADGFTGLRALLTPADRRPAIDRRRRRPGAAAFGVESAGRWALLPEPPESGRDDAVERCARSLLRRYGVAFRALLERESLLPPWRELLACYRRLEARGEIRGGRFVDGFSGEQFALPDAVARLRSLRRERTVLGSISVSGSDPLNLVGVIVPGPRLAAVPANRLLYRDGLPLALLDGGQASFLTELEPAARWDAHKALVGRRVPAQLRAYLGRRAASASATASAPRSRPRGS